MPRIRPTAQELFPSLVTVLSMRSPDLMSSSFARCCSRRKYADSFGSALIGDSSALAVAFAGCCVEADFGRSVETRWRAAQLGSLPNDPPDPVACVACRFFAGNGRANTQPFMNASVSGTPRRPVHGQ